ncbi:hypothetical protein MMC26_004602 [Xylographa opegraphella]|nr:hypothetical protein [Xylographa opegraphella]
MRQFKFGVVLAFIAASAAVQQGFPGDESGDLHVRETYDLYERDNEFGDFNFNLNERNEPEIHAREADPFHYEELSHQRFFRRDPGRLFARGECHGEGYCRGKKEATCMVLPMSGKPACTCPAPSCGGRGSNQECECNGKSGEIINNSEWDSASTVSSADNKSDKKKVGDSKKRPAPGPAVQRPAQRHRTQKRNIRIN